MPLFPDRLLAAIADKGTPICVGIDPVYEMLPDAIAGDSRSRDLSNSVAAIDAIFDFTTRLIQLIAPLVPCVKFQSAYFEKYYHEGVEAYFELVHEAHENGLIVIGDVKLEASQFRGREPDQHRWNIEAGSPDSTAARISWNPTRNWSLQASWAHLISP